MSFLETIEFRKDEPESEPIAVVEPAELTDSEMCEVLQSLEQREMPVTHSFRKGTYVREIFMPADTYVIGHVHKTRHINVVICGKAIVTMNGERSEIVGPCAFWSEAGVQKRLLIVEDMHWMTIHPNPEEVRDIPTLELDIVDLPASFSEKGALALDDFRMLKTRENLALK